MRWWAWRRRDGDGCPPGWELGQAASQGLTVVLAEHIDACQRCASELRALERLRQRARTLAAPTMPATSRERIVMALRLEAILPRRSPRAPAPRFPPWVVATTVGITIVGGTILTAHLGRQMREPPPLPPSHAALAVPAPPPVTSPAAPRSAVAPAAAYNAPRPAARHPRLAALTRTAAVTATPTDRVAFEKGWQFFRNGDYLAAATAFADLERQAAGDAIVEDALFWRGVALGRAGEKVQARAAIASFVGRFPRSARVGQACASLGWMLVESGDRVGARTLFERAGRDGSETVRASARRGLQEIEASDAPAPPPRLTDEPATR